VQQHWKSIASYSTVGLEFAGSVLFGLFFGRWLDGRFGTGQVLTFVGLGIGMLAGYRTVWRALKLANREAEREEQAEKESRKQFHDE
jgi:F0F1-type ATP synthase assembly protein I